MKVSREQLEVAFRDWILNHKEHPEDFEMTGDVELDAESSAIYFWKLLMKAGAR